MYHDPERPDSPLGFPSPKFRPPKGESTPPMTALISHFKGKNWPDQLMAILAFFGFLGGLGGCVFGLVKMSGMSVQSPEARLTAIQAAEQADRTAIQAHEDAIKQLAATKGTDDNLTPRVSDLERWAAEHKSAIVQKDREFAELQISLATTNQKLDDLRSFMADKMTEMSGELREIRREQSRLQKKEAP